MLRASRPRFCSHVLYDTLGVFVNLSCATVQGIRNFREEGALNSPLKKTRQTRGTGVGLAQVLCM